MTAPRREGKGKLDWKPISEQAVKWAEELGHKLGPFELHRDPRMSPSLLKMASCETCGGCCWILHDSKREFRCGGRLVKYRCGTPEAAGFKSGNLPNGRTEGDYEQCR